MYIFCVCVRVCMCICIYVCMLTYTYTLVHSYLFRALGEFNVRENVFDSIHKCIFSTLVCIYVPVCVCVGIYENIL